MDEYFIIIIQKFYFMRNYNVWGKCKYRLDSIIIQLQKENKIFSLSLSILMLLQLIWYNDKKKNK